MTGIENAGATADDPILVEARGAARWIWFNRPRVHNAQDLPMLRMLDRALADVEDDEDVRVLVLAGKGKSFCAGHDLKQSVSDPEYRARQSTAESRWRQERRWFTRPVDRLRALTIPTICRVQGHCLTAGLTFVEACDFVVAAPDASFGSPAMTAVETNDAEVSTFVRNIGVRRAKQLLWLDERLTAAEALQLGLVNWVVEPESIDAHIDALVERLTSVAKSTLELSKGGFRFLESRQGWDDYDAYHFQAHQLSHHTSAAQRFYRERVDDRLQGDAEQGTR